MAYTQSAERYAIGKTPMTPREGHALPEGWCLFDEVYSDIADATPLQGVWRLTSLIGKVRSIEAYSPKTQADILRVVIRDMQTLPAEADRIKRLAGGYVWVFGREATPDADPAATAEA